MDEPSVGFETSLEWTASGLQMVTRVIRRILADETPPTTETSVEHAAQVTGMTSAAPPRRPARSAPDGRGWVAWAAVPGARLAVYHTRLDCELLPEGRVEQVAITRNPRLVRRVDVGGHLRTDTGAPWKECSRCRERHW